MSAAGNDAQPRTQPPCVLEGVIDRQLNVLRAPQHQDRTADALELLPWVVYPQRLPRAVDVGVQKVRSEETFNRLVRQADGIRNRHEAEHKPTQQRSEEHTSELQSREAPRSN